jgi:hypothetical protein
MHLLVIKAYGLKLLMHFVVLKAYGLSRKTVDALVGPAVARQELAIIRRK